jgi:hypothetical protein
MPVWMNVIFAGVVVFLLWLVVSIIGDARRRKQ